VTDLRSWPKKWNDASLSDFVALPEFKQSGQWPLFGMLALGLVAGAAIGGYAVSHRAQMKRLAKHARRMGVELAAMGASEEVGPASAKARSNHRRRAKVEV
jgi:hypothetical protein